MPSVPLDKIKAKFVAEGVIDEVEAPPMPARVLRMLRKNAANFKQCVKRIWQHR